MTKTVWYNGDVDFVGGSGMNTLQEFTEEILKSEDEGMKEIFSNLGADFTYESVHSALLEEGVSAIKVPNNIVNDESWSEDDIERISENETVGKGYTKVFGFSL